LDVGGLKPRRNKHYIAEGQTNDGDIETTSYNTYVFHCSEKHLINSGM